MLNIRYIKGDVEKFLQCTHLEWRYLEGAFQRDPTLTKGQRGWNVELCNTSDGDVVKVLNLPEDADRLYVMNEMGDTIDSKQWPPPSGQQGNQVQVRSSRDRNRRYRRVHHVPST